MGARGLDAPSVPDELKSHLFSVHFSDCFLYKKTDLYAGIWNKLHQIAVQQEIQKKAEIAVNKSRMWPSVDDIICCSRLQQEQIIKDERTKCREDLTAVKMRIQVASV